MQSPDAALFESLNHEPRETICMEKPLQVEWAKSQVITRVELTVIDKYMRAQIWSPLSGSVRIGLRKGTMAPASISVLEKSTRPSTPQLSPGCQTIQFLPESLWYLWSCCPQCWNSEQVSPSTFMLLRGMLGTQQLSILLSHNTQWFLQPEVMGIFLSSIGTLS